MTWWSISCEIINQEIVTMKIYLSAVSVKCVKIVLILMSSINACKYNQVIFWYMSTEAPRNTSKQYRRAVDLNWTSSIDVVYGVG